MEKVFLRARGVHARAHVVSHHSNSDGISPSLTLMSPSNFHKMHTFLRVTNACHCIVMMAYTNIQGIALLFHYFFHTKLIAKPPGLLLLPPSPVHTPPRTRGTADSQAAEHVSCVAAPARKRDTRLAAAGFGPPFSGIQNNAYIYI